MTRSVPVAPMNGFGGLSSFDQINLGSTLLQSAVIVGFASALQGVARHFDRPGTRALAGYWRLFGVSAVLNIFSSWSGAVWDNRALSRVLTTLLVALIAAGIPYVRRAVAALAHPALPPRPVWRDALRWGLTVFVLHAVGVFGSAALFAEWRVLTVTWSRALLLAVLVVPTVIAWRARRAATSDRAPFTLLTVGLGALALRQIIAVVVGLRVGQTDLPLALVIGIVTLDLLAVSAGGVSALLAATAEEVVHVARQARELARVQLRLAQAERMESLGRMAAAIAHDMNNVLQVLGMSMESLLGRERGRASRAMPAEVAAAMQHGRSLTTQLLTFARAREAKLERFDATARLKSLDALLRVMTGTAVELRVSATASIALCMDPSQFEQIVLNLVSNARDAVAAGGRVLVLLERVTLPDHHRREVTLAPGEYARLSVTDTGAGIPPELRDAIFEPFVTTKPVGSGTGLGLSTVHGIAKQAAGDVRLASSSGRGTTFEVYLPAA